MTAEIYAKTSWMPQRISPTSRRGMVAAKMPQAAQVGADILAAGGNAVDAAVATAFAMGVCEPAMSGLGGGGYMVIWLAKEQKALLIDYAMKSAQAATPDMFPMLDPDSAGASLFGWPSTEGNHHVEGPRSIAVPGTLAGLALALEKYGTLSLAEVLQPAITIAEDGFPVTWQVTNLIAKALKSIRKQPETARIWLDDNGDAPFSSEQASPTLLKQPELATTLRKIAEGGPDVLYRGEIGQAIVAHLQSHGSVLTMSDFENYDVQELAPATINYRDHRIHTATNGSGGTSLSQALKAMDLVQPGSPARRTADQWHTIASIFRQAFADRFTYLGDPAQNDIPLDALKGEEHAQRTVDAIGERATTPTPAPKDVLGVTHDLDGSVPEYMKDGSTTHLSVIDGEGNAVAITQTLLALFGSFVTVPGTGMLMNNGMMWFDPEPGRPNSIGGGKRPLSNMAPVLIEKNGTVVASLGASGGRKIMNCNAQLVMNIVDSAMSAQEAIDAPRIDCSTRNLVASNRISADVLEGLAEKGYTVGIRHEGLLSGDFSSPVAVHRAADGTLNGGADPFYFGATVVGVED